MKKLERGNKMNQYRDHYCGLISEKDIDKKSGGGILGKMFR